MQDETQVLIWCRGLNPYSRTVRQYYLYKFQPSHFLGSNIITLTVKNCGRWDGWLTAEEKICKEAPINYFNDSGDNSILDAEGNACGIIAIPSIESTFDNDHIHVLHDLPKRYIYGYLISKLMSLEATIQNMILQNICLLLI